MRVVYEKYWHLNRSPFGHDRGGDFFFAGSTHHSALLKLNYLIEHRGGAGLLVGASGSGKTQLIDIVRQKVTSAGLPFVSVVYPQMSPSELLSYISNRLGGENGVYDRVSADIVLSSLEARLREHTEAGRRAIVVIDDAHTISDRHTLQTLQLLLNLQQPGLMDFTLILAGQPELVGAVKRLPQLDDRISMPCVLQSLSCEETAAYVQYRLRIAGVSNRIFTDSALKTIHDLSGGLPRRINRLCDFALLVGYAEEKSSIDSEQIEGVHSELTLGLAA